MNRKKIKYKKIIIWGHPLYSHTHSYIHEAYYKAFKYLGYDVYWFDDKNYPIDFDYTNCLFIGEGFAADNIPLNNTSCYMIMYCPSPAKYIEAGVGRYIDIRMAATDFKDHIQEYSLDKSLVTDIGPSCYYEPKTNNNIIIKNNYVNYSIKDFDKIYISWATNLLPCEINFDDMHLPRENNIYYCGTISYSGECETVSNLNPFIESCKEYKINFIHNDCWNNPLTSAQVIELSKKSILGIDIRGKKHIKENLVTCRVFKNISYGHLGLTNSLAIYESMDGNCIYNIDTKQLFHDGINNKNNYKLIKKGMNYVKNNHTYLNRINSLLEVVNV